jgi:hypothetical protein
MKKLLLILVTVLFCLWADNSLAQMKKRERIEAIKIAFITKRIDLQPEESQNFWPLYNQYQKEIGDLIMQRRAARNDPDADAIDALDEDLDIEGKIVAVRKKYRKEFAKVLSPEKINQFYQAERDFREELIKQLKNRRP